jgi:hypothetical protein
MLLRYAKLAGGLRLLVAEMAPLVLNSISVLSTRSAAYLVGFTLGSIASVWLPIIAVLISVTGLFGLFSGSSECDAYQAQIAEIDAANILIIEKYRADQENYDKWLELVYKPYLKDAYEKNTHTCDAALVEQAKIQCSIGSSVCYSPYTNCIEGVKYTIESNAPIGPVISKPELQSYPCSGGSGGGPDCPAGKKVWLQVLWGNPTGNFSDSKGCFIIGYSQDAPDLPFNIEYNPFLPEPFVKSMALSYYSVQGDRFRQLDNPNWKNLESVQGWDKGYWIAESVNPECRGWSPGWSRKIK